MTDIFNTSMLSAEPARYVVIAEACLPGLIFLIMAWWMRSGCEDYMYKGVYGAPRGAFEVLTHLIMVALWTIALVVAACNFSSTALCVVAATSMLALVFGLLWMWMYLGNIHKQWERFVDKEKSEGHPLHKEDFDPKTCPKECQWPNLCLYIAWLGILTSAITAAANSASEESRLACAGMLAPVAGWFGAMMLWTYLATRKCSIEGEEPKLPKYPYGR